MTIFTLMLEWSFSNSGTSFCRSSICGFPTAATVMVVVEPPPPPPAPGEQAATTRAISSGMASTAWDLVGTPLGSRCMSVLIRRPSLKLGGEPRPGIPSSPDSALTTLSTYNMVWVQAQAQFARRVPTGGPGAKEVNVAKCGDRCPGAPHHAGGGGAGRC